MKFLDFILFFPFFIGCATSPKVEMKKEKPVDFAKVCAPEQRLNYFMVVRIKYLEGNLAECEALLNPK